MTARIGLALALVLITACTDWPPDEAALREHFKANEQVLESLASSIRGSDYVQVRLGSPELAAGAVRIQTPEAFSPEAIYIANRGDNTELRKQTLADDHPMITGLLDAGVESVLYAAELDLVSVFPYDGPISEPRTSVVFQRQREISHRHVPCEAEFRDIDCGRCAVRLSDDWYLLYAWSRLPDHLNEPPGEDADLDARNAEIEAVERRCTAVGDALIGYRGDPFRPLEWGVEDAQ